MKNIQGRANATWSEWDCNILICWRFITIFLLLRFFPSFYPLTCILWINHNFFVPNVQFFHLMNPMMAVWKSSVFELSISSLQRKKNCFLSLNSQIYKTKRMIEMKTKLKKNWSPAAYLSKRTGPMATRYGRHNFCWISNVVGLDVWNIHEVWTRLN